MEIWWNGRHPTLRMWCRRRESSSLSISIIVNSWLWCGFGILRKTSIVAFCVQIVYNRICSCLMGENLCPIIGRYDGLFHTEKMKFTTFDSFGWLKTIICGIAQRGRASVYGTECQRFESSFRSYLMDKRLFYYLIK